LFHIALVAALAVLAYLSFRHVAASAAAVAGRPPAAHAVQDTAEFRGHLANANDDVGPGQAEPAVARHPQR
jgi:hypothetical protein